MLSRRARDRPVRPAVPEHRLHGCTVHGNGLRFPVSSDLIRKKRSHMVIPNRGKTMSVCLGLVRSNIFLEH